MASPPPTDNLIIRIGQTLAVLAMIIAQVGSFVFMPTLTVYIIIYTRLRWIWLLFIGWYSFFDAEVTITGRRRSEWVRSWSWWYYAKNYYPVKVFKANSEKLDPKRNYLFCFYPHGMLCPSTFLTMATNVTDFQILFPDHKTHLHTLSVFFSLPLMREIGIRCGAVRATREALEYILSKEGGGNISGLVVGGASEAYYCKPGVHKIILKKRKGFVRIALMKGAPLVPVYSFGENELFSQFEFDENSLVQKCREFIRRQIGFSLIFVVGRKDMLGLLPRRKALNIVVGQPIEVKKIENPTQEEIDHLHQLFEKKLVELFDSQKKYFLTDYKTAHLEII